MPTTNDFLVSTSNAGNQREPQITALANGGFVVTWMSTDNGSDFDIRGQVFAADGTPVDGTDILISTSNANRQFSPQITALQNGGFAVTWYSEDNGSNWDIRAQVFATDGTPVDGTDILISTSNANYQESPQITALSNGGFVITWHSNDNGSNRDIRAQVFAADGTPVDGTDILVSTSNANYQEYPQITALSNGGFVVTWQSNDNGSNYDIRSQVFGADGTPLDGTDILVSTSNTIFQELPQIAALANGGFVITWNSYDNGSDWDIRGQVFAADGTPVGGSDILVSTSNAGNQEGPQITALANGGFVITWQSQDNGTDFDIRAQVFAADGTPIDGTDILISTSNTSNQGAPQIAALPNGGFVITWQSLDNGSNNDIRAQVFSSDGTPVDGTDILVSTSNTYEQDTPQITTLANGDFVVSWRWIDFNSDTDEIRARVFQPDGTPGPSPITINGTTGNDTLTGTASDETINGIGGNDSINGGGGTDIMVGGEGNDTYVTDGGDTITENPNEGTDTVQSSVAYTLGDNLENLTLTGSANINGFGNTLDNVITGNAGDNYIMGGGGNDTLAGGGGSDTLVGGTGDDIYIVDYPISIDEGANGGIDEIRSSISTGLPSPYVENLRLTGSDDINGWGNEVDNIVTGNSGNNTLYGEGGNDTLDGGDGVNTLIGGEGNDTYVIDATGTDTITENANAGTDTVQSSITYTLGGNLENLTLTGSANIDGTGNTENNVITGNSGNNTLTGGDGNDTLDGNGGTDTLIGGVGNDVYVTDGGDTITENANEGTDTVQASVTYTLGDNLENLTLIDSANINGTGNELANQFFGNSGINTLSGLGGNDVLIGGGNDTLIGGADDDLYFTDGGDTIAEGANEGTDRVNSSVTYTLGDNLENLTLTGSANINGTGNTLDNRLTGNDGNNTLTGGDGADTLDGNGGTDTLIGGTGNDTYVTDGGDTITENANEGTDTVQASVTYTLGTTLENLTLTGSANINGTGNAQSNVITGNSGSNTLDGAGGTDTFVGGDGNDLYIIDGGDTITEDANQGTDTVQSSATFTLSDHIENLTLTGSGNINGTGNTLNNTITGNSGVNTLSGGDGADTISGAAGADTLNGGAGNDTFTYANGTELELGEVINGGDDIDTIQMNYTGLLNLTLANSLTGVERIVGSGINDQIVISGRIMGGITEIDGGAGPDVLQIRTGRAVDLRNVTLTSIESITTTLGNNVTIRVADYATAALIDGSNATITLDASGFTLSAGERTALFAQGIDEIQQPGGMRLFADGSTLTVGAQTQINEQRFVNGHPVSRSPIDPSITTLSDGRYVVVWDEGYRTYGQIFDAAGAAVGSNFEVDPGLNGATRPFHVAVAAVSGGGFVIASEDYNGADGSNAGIFVQRFTNAGTSLGPAVQVNTYTTDYQQYPDVVGLTGGRYLVTWNSNGQDGSSGGVYAQLFNANGTRSGGEFRINSFTSDYQGAPDITALANGGFIATFMSRGQTIANYDDIRLQIYDANGATVSSDLSLTAIYSRNGAPSISSFPDGSFVVTWLVQGSGSGEHYNATGYFYEYQIVGRRYNANGTPNGAEFRVDATDDYAIQGDPQVTTLANGGFVVTWNQGRTNTLANNDVYGQLFDASGNAVGAQFLVNEPGTGNYLTAVVTPLFDGSFVISWRANGDNGIPSTLFQRHYDSSGNVLPNTDTLTAGNDTVNGTIQNDTISTAPDHLNAGDVIIGGGIIDTDTLQMTSAGTLDLTAPTTFTGIEQINGTSGVDTFIVSQARLNGVMTIDGGASIDYIQLAGAGTLDLTNVTLTGVERIMGTDGSDTITGSAGDDIIYGWQSVATAADTINGGDGNDQIFTGSAADTINGGNGNDRINAGAGANIINGGDGDDRFFIFGSDLNIANLVSLDGGTGTDRAEFVGSVNLSNFSSFTSIERILIVGENNGAGTAYLQATAAQFAAYNGQNLELIRFTGNTLSTIVVINGISGGQSFSAANWTFTDWNTSTLIQLRADTATSAVTITGSSQNESLMGGHGDDTLNGGGGNDALYGGAGADTISGGAGDDVYGTVDASDILIENANEGEDAVNASISYTLGANFERLFLQGTDNINGTGNTLDNVVYGNSGNNRLDGGDGLDQILGYAGDDTLNGDAGADLLAGGEGNDTLNGGADNDTLDGDVGNDRLDGGTGDDQMYGGTGNDVYVVDSAFDGVNENAGEEIDTVETTLATYSLAGLTFVENLRGTSTSGQTLTGNASDNRIEGAGGDDILDGGNGIDTLVGGAGNDLYIIDNASDAVSEGVGGGTDDGIRTGLTTYSLLSALNVERLEGTNGAGQTLSGNTLANTILGAGGDDTLDGGEGADSLTGGLGNDTYVIDNTGDSITELANEGTDTVRSSISYTLGATLENLTLLGVVGINGTGNAGDNIIVGNAAGNILDGGLGADTLTGGGGDDTFLFTGTSGADTITDFVEAGGADRIDLRSFTTISALAQVIALGAQVGADAVFTFAPGNTLTLQGVTLANLVADDFLLAPGPTSVLNGTPGIDNVVGTAGNDALDGLAGDDRIDGAGGDDRIIYDADDTPSGVFGGAGFDTLVVTTSGSLPSLFNLSAQGFEAAERSTNDVGNLQPWTTLIESYNTAWQLTQEDRRLDDGSRRITSLDPVNSQSWSLIVQDFNAGGNRTLQMTYNDDNSRVADYFDPANIESWSSLQETYNAAGARTVQRIYNDAGDYRFFYWDPANLETWTTFDDQYNALGQRHTQRLNYDDGTMRYYYWDVSNAQPWSVTDERFSAAGDRLQQTIVSDDGSISQQYWDPAGAAAYSTYVDYFNAAGQRLEQRIFHDQGGNIGGYTRIYYDVANANPWQNRTDVFNSLGVRISQTDVPD